MEPLSIEEVQHTSRLRSQRWHATPAQQWTVLEIAGAMCGEAGEAANVAKKIRRIEQGIEYKQENKDADLRAKLAEECADTFLYLVLLCNKVGVELQSAVVEKFNRVSEANGFPERL